MIMSNIIRSRKLTRIIPLNSEEVAWSQPRIIEFLSDNANKDNTWLCASSSPDAEKTSNLSPQVETELLKESVSEAEGTAKMLCFIQNSATPMPTWAKTLLIGSETPCTYGIEIKAEYESGG